MVPHPTSLTGIRLRTVEDDFPDNDPTPDDPVDPVPPDTGSGQAPGSEAIRSGDPVDSQKLFDKEEIGIVSSITVVESFSENHRITGSFLQKTPQDADTQAVVSSDPVVDPPNTIGMQQALLIDSSEIPPEKSDVLRYFPDLTPSCSKRRLT